MSAAADAAFVGAVFESSLTTFALLLAPQPILTKELAKTYMGDKVVSNKNQMRPLQHIDFAWTLRQDTTTEVTSATIC